MKILHISSDFYYTRVYERLVNLLDELKFIQTVFVPLKKGLSIKRMSFNLNKNICVIKSINFTNLMRYFYFVKLISIFRDIKKKIVPSSFDLIYAHFLHSDGGVAYLLKKKFGVRYIAAIRNSDVNVFFKYFKFIRWWSNLLLINAEALIFITPSYKKKVLNMYVKKSIRHSVEKKSYVIPNVLDQFWLSNNIKCGKTLNILKTINFICVCETSKNKNIHSTFVLLDKLSEKHKICFTIIGPEGDYHETIMNSINNRPYEVKYLGEIKDMNLLLQYYRDNDIYIMPSKHETFGVSYIEAMSQGIPVIYSKGEGITGFFEEGEIGIGIDINNIKQSIEKIELILSKYENISLNCISNVQRFSADFIKEEYSNMFNSVLLRMKDDYKATRW